MTYPPQKGTQAMTHVLHVALGAPTKLGKGLHSGDPAEDSMPMGLPERSTNTSPDADAAPLLLLGGEDSPAYHLAIFSSVHSQGGCGDKVFARCVCAGGELFAALSSSGGPFGSKQATTSLVSVGLNLCLFQLPELSQRKLLNFSENSFQQVRNKKLEKIRS